MIKEYTCNLCGEIVSDSTKHHATFHPDRQRVEFYMVSIRKPLE